VAQRVNKIMQEKSTSILIVGASTGGVAATLAALRMGQQVILTEESDWIGGQLTAQGVPPDENPWIDREGVGCTASYRQYRDGVRAYYRRNYPMKTTVKDDPYFNPGRGNVSPLCHEPQIGVAVLYEMLMPYLASQRLELLLNTVPVAAETDGDVVRSVTLRHILTGDEVVISAPYILDATELGDLLELANVEHIIGAESQAQTGELHALEDEPDPLDQQSHSWTFVLDYHPDENHIIEKPEQYDFWRDYQADFWPAKQLSWTTSDPETLEPVTRPIFAGPTDDPLGDDLWHFRRIVYRQHYPADFHCSDVVVVNWPQIDYWLGQLLGVSAEEKVRHWEGARQLSLSLLYWMQTEAPRHDKDYGYPGLRLRGDIYGTSDGFAKYPYIRESRRIQAEFTVLEQHVGVEARGDLQGAEVFSDSVGIGSYRIDLHPSYRRNYVDITNWPFQIPLGSLIPARVENLLPACKNLGVTHITNGCYRLHPVEWNIGEAAGALTAYCLQKNLTPKQVRNETRYLEDFQSVLRDNLGFELAWPESQRTTPRIKFDRLGI
jgi:hypothetical protein